MQNPWTALPAEAPYVLPDDAAAVEGYHHGVGEAHRLRTELLPEPYLGRPDAPVLLLNLNPGYAPEDEAFYSRADVLSLWQRNLLHQSQEYPFYLLHPDLAAESGPCWWSRRLRSLVALAGREAVANGLCCVEYFPYHSLRFRTPDQILPSQKYNFWLVQQALNRGVLVLIMRGERFWRAAVPELEDYPRLVRLRSVQNVTVSPNNCPDGFTRIAETLLKQKEHA